MATRHRQGAARHRQQNQGLSPWLNWHTARFLAWTANIPIAIFTPLKYSVAYLVFLSVAALVESSGTDVLNHVKAFREAQRTRIIESEDS